MSEQNKILFAQLVCCAKISQKFSRIFSIVQPNMGYYTDIQHINQFYSPTQVQPCPNPAPTWDIYICVKIVR